MTKPTTISATKITLHSRSGTTDSTEHGITNITFTVETSTREDALERILKLFTNQDTDVEITP